MPVEELRKIYENGNTTSTTAAQSSGSSANAIPVANAKEAPAVAGKRERPEDVDGTTEDPPSKKPAS